MIASSPVSLQPTVQPKGQLGDEGAGQVKAVDRRQSQGCSCRDAKAAGAPTLLAQPISVCVYATSLACRQEQHGQKRGVSIGNITQQKSIDAVAGSFLTGAVRYVNTGTPSG